MAFHRSSGTLTLASFKSKVAAEPQPPVITKPSPQPKQVKERKEPPPPFVYEPADAETFAHNQRMEALWHAAPDQIETLLRERYPNTFSDTIKPLKIGIHRDIERLLGDQFEPQHIRRFQKRWVKRPEYLAAVAAGQARVNLFGTPVETSQGSQDRP